MSFLGTRGWDRKAWKYRLAHVLDKLPWTCWAALVGWAEYGAAFRVTQQAALCQSDRCGGCYCGKLGGGDSATPSVATPPDNPMGPAS